MTAATLFGNGAGITNVSAGKLLRKTSYFITRQSISHLHFQTMIPFHKLQRELNSFLRHIHQAQSNCDLFIIANCSVRETANNTDRKHGIVCKR